MLPGFIFKRPLKAGSRPSETSKDSSSSESLISVAGRCPSHEVSCCVCLRGPKNALKAFRLEVLRTG